uniref:Serine carboxypeptidase S28 n=1 Tax=Panagrolaimus sp. ES5 TaxID=591445 RepID=A0AC34FEI3_9BILA
MLKFLLIFGFFGTILAVEGSGRSPRPSHIPRYVFGRPYHGFMSHLEDSVKDCESGSYQEGYLLQPLDHFNSSNSGMWPEYYQYNFQFYNSSTSDLVFFMLGGESAIGAKWVCQTSYAYLQWAKQYGAAVFQAEHRYFGKTIGAKWVCQTSVAYLQWAKQYGAAVFQAEHRYFGKSKPKPDQSVANLQWFTPEQILADYNYFISQMNKQYFGGKQMRWVLFGGSYPGSLTAWMRIAYPNASIGGLSSSSAVNLWVDYYGYATNMQKNYKKQSSSCAMNIGDGFKKIQSMSYSEAGRAQ